MSQPSLITSSGEPPSFHSSYYHQIVYAKFNLQIYFPPHYLREFWYFKDGDTELVKKANHKFNGQIAF